MALDSTPKDLLTAVQWDLKGKVLKAGSRSLVTQVDVGAHSYVFKQYSPLAFRRRLRYALTRSRARQSWENGQMLADLGLPVIRPLAFFEELKLGIPQRSLLIMPFQPGTPIDEYPQLTQIQPILRKVFMKMAQHQITHGDLKATNIIIDEKAQPHFIDIDASQAHSKKSSYRKARKKDEELFLKNWHDHPENRQIFEGVFS